MFGVDFLCASSDFVVASWTDGTISYIYKDPDPVQLWSRGLVAPWRVYTGDVTVVEEIVDGDLTFVTYGFLDAVDGTGACGRWSDAWLEDEVAAARAAAPLDVLDLPGEAPAGALVWSDPLSELGALALPMPSMLLERDPALAAFRERMAREHPMM